MEKSQAQLRKNSSLSDQAVSGLFGGLLGGLAMALVIALFSLSYGQGLAFLGYFSTETAAAPLQGVLMHLAVAGVYGMLYQLLRHWLGLGRLKIPGVLVGLVYGVLLWAVAVTVLLPAARSIMLSIAWPAFFFGHVAYGLVLGWRQA